ncbi:MAG: YbaK/EbsC family protein [Planctomycetes bacterium]|nr:YbaK/EbsC family protein [Planctomycetota bacterium]
MHERIRAIFAQQPLVHRVWEHAHAPTPIRSPADFAAFSGIPRERIAKTLFLAVHGGAQPYALAVCAITAQLDLAAVARLLAATSATLGSRQALAEQLGYPPHGVSPLGAGAIPVLLDEQLFAHPTIAIGAGQAGVEIELAPDDLATLSGGRRGQLV